MKAIIFGQLDNGQDVTQYTLENGQIQIEILNYGAIIRSLFVPDQNGHADDIVLGYDTLEPYLKNPANLGCIIGRFANRIAEGRFEIDGVRYELIKNNGPCSLHGGENQPLHRVSWDALVKGQNTLELSHRSLDMADGFPGNVDFKVTYSLSDQQEFSIKYEATTDKKTVINLTNHGYFNLSGKHQDILDHELQIKGSKAIRLNEYQLPMEIMDISNSPLDFRVLKEIGRDINLAHEQLKIGHGYDNNWVVNPKMAPHKHVGKLVHRPSGRSLDVYTSEPGIQIYTANHLDLKGKEGRHYQKHHGVCLETQHYPDSPNRPDFPSTLLNPGETFKSETIFKFSLWNK